MQIYNNLGATHAVKKLDNKEPLSDRQKRIIEYVRNGIDFDVSNEELVKLLE